MIRDRARLGEALNLVHRVVRDRWRPLEAEVDRLGRLPDDVVQEMRDLGLFSFGVPEEYGGMGMTCEELAHINMAVSQCSYAFRTRLSNNIGIGFKVFEEAATEDQKRIYLPRIASGETIVAFAVSELGVGGSKATKMAATAVQDGTDWVVNASKCYVSLAPVADLLLVFARTETEACGFGGITAFLVARDADGLTIGEPYRKMGQHGMPMSEVHLRDCRVDGSAILGGKPGLGFEALWKGFLFQRINLAGLSIGPAIRLIEEGVNWAKSNPDGAEPAASHQLVQSLLAESQVEVTAATALLLEVARKYDCGDDIVMEASISKYFSTEMACRVADRIVQVLGARGYIADYSPVEHLYRDVRGGRMAEGTSQIHLLTIARQMLAG